MTMLNRLGIATGILMFAAATIAVEAGGYGQQYYGNWNHYPSRGYHYCSYNYKPYESYPTYSYHYCICYPSQPNYVYYYNPHRGHYWGRCDLQTGMYSLLAEGDRRSTVEAIPEKAFPTPGQMPLVPAGVTNGQEVASKGNVRIDVPPAPPFAEKK